MLKDENNVVVLFDKYILKYLLKEGKAYVELKTIRKLKKQMLLLIFCRLVIYFFDVM